MQGQAFGFQRHHVQGLRVINQRQLALRGEGVDQRVEVLLGIGQAGDMGYRRDTNARQLVGERLAVIDHMVRARLADPLLALGTRGGADHRHGGQFTGQLGQDRPHAARRADD